MYHVGEENVHYIFELPSGMNSRKFFDADECFQAAKVLGIKSISRVVVTYMKKAN